MFHLKLKELREKSKLTQKELAIQLNISRSSLSLYELGVREPDFLVLKNIAKHFDVSIDYLLDCETKNINVINSTEIYKKIGSLSEQSKIELEKYVDLLKVNEIYENSKENSAQNSINRKTETQ